MRVKLGDVCSKASSNIVQKDLDGHQGEYPIFGASGFIKCVDFYQQEKPYIAVVKDGAGVGRVMKLPAKSSVIGTMQYIIPNDRVDIGYLAYAMEYMNLSKYYTGATIPHIYFKDYRKEPLPLPPFEEQHRFAALLDKISSLMDKRRQQLAKLDELVNARFVEMFGDVIQNNNKWKLYKFSDIAISRLGKMLDAKKQTGKCAFPYLANFNVQWFRFDLDNLNQMDFDEDDRIEFELKDGDLLVCEGGEIGRCAVWHNELQPCYFQKALHRVRCNQNLVHPDYLAWWFKYNCDNGGFSAIAGAKATIAHLPGVKLKELNVAIPPIELQTQFAAFVQSTDQIKSNIQSSLNELETLKKSLMQTYFG
ncbi:MAG: restriction endonuclease subunit S [Clostridiales bacterium]|nr:restriction endonuclease subunit S [Clostridiales bacterium]